MLGHDAVLASALLADWQRIFPHRFYLEISRVGKANEHEYIAAILKLAEKYALPVVATNDARFLDKKSSEIYRSKLKRNHTSLRRSVLRLPARYWAAWHL